MSEPTDTTTEPPGDRAARDTVPVSVLDLAGVAKGQSSGDALRATTSLAQVADRLGYRRFWVAEHHNMPMVASTSPAVLVAHLAAATQHIRLGSGGVMLPNFPPLVVAEQFAMLEALHPGRIDLGVGRAPGTDPVTAAALRRSPDALGADDFPQHLLDLLGLLGDERVDDGLAERLTATPAATGVPPVWLLGSSGYSAQVAGRLGLPFAFAHHFGGRDTDAALQMYREGFTPSPALRQPYAIVTASVIAADSAEEARWLAGPSRVASIGLLTNRLAPVVTPEEAERFLAGVDDERLAALRGTQVTGTGEQVAERLRRLVGRTGADELMVTATAHDGAVRERSLELLAKAWPLL
ncbi:MAG: LLM class flavin-dependent oxidoreductase [Actinomycetota bacterium]|nr:LLM class flavin-dependent oxidoreductase [Actinomycetota bacterium]